MAARSHLRQSRRAAGQLQRDQAQWVDLDGGERSAGPRIATRGEDVGEPDRAVRCGGARDDQRADAEPGAERDEVAVAEVGLHEVAAGAGVRREVRDLAFPVLGQRGDRDDARLDAAVVGDHGLGLVAALEHHAVAGSQRRGGEQPGGEVVGQCVELGVGQSGLDGDQGRPFGVRAGGAAQHVPERLAGPETGPAVLRDAVGWERWGGVRIVGHGDLQKV